MLIRLRKPPAKKIKVSCAELQIAFSCSDASPSKTVITFVASCANDVVIQAREVITGVAHETALDVVAGLPDGYAGGQS